MWQDLGFAERDLRGLPGRFAFGVVVPQLLFFLGLRQGGLAAALGIAGGWSLVLQLYEVWRRHSWDPFLVYGLAFTIVQGAAAVYTNSPAVYAGGGIVENLLAAVLFLGSVAVCRPLLVEVLGSAGGAKAVFTLPVQRALRRLTTLWALLFLTRSGALYVGLTHLPIGQFLFVNTLTGWPLNGVGIVLSILYIRAHIRRSPHAGRVSPVGRPPMMDAPF